MCCNRSWHRLPWRENVTTRRASGVLMVGVHSHTHLMLLLTESSTARSTLLSSSWKREPIAMSSQELHIRDQPPRHLLNWPSQTQRKQLLLRISQKNNLKRSSTSWFLALLSVQAVRTVLNFHVVEYYCRIVFKVYFWIWLTLLQIMPWYKILNCTSFSKFFLLKFSTLGKRRRNERSQVVISTLIEWLFFLGYLLTWLPAFSVDARVWTLYHANLYSSNLEDFKLFEHWRRTKLGRVLA